MAETSIAFDVQVVDGEINPVPGLDVGARFSYRASSRTWSNSTTDADGCAHFDDLHPEAPDSVCLYVGDDHCGTYPVSDGHEIVLEM